MSIFLLSFIIIVPYEFFTSALVDPLSLKSGWHKFQVSWTIVFILADLNNIVVWMVSTSPLIYNSSSHLAKHLQIVKSAPITIGITVSFKFLIIIIYSLRVFHISVS